MLYYTDTRDAYVEALLRRGQRAVDSGDLPGAQKLLELARDLHADRVSLAQAKAHATLLGMGQPPK